MSVDTPQPTPQDGHEFGDFSPELLDAFDDLMSWSSGPVPEGAYACCARQWPVARRYFLREWELNLRNPERDEAATSLPIAGLYLAAANSDASFLEVLLRFQSIGFEHEQILVGDIFVENGSALMALMARSQSAGIARLEEACLPDPKLDAMRQSISLEALALLVEHGACPRERFDNLIRRMDAMMGDDGACPDRWERRQWMACVLVDIGPGELLELAKSWWEATPPEDADVLVGQQSLLESASAPKEERLSRWHGWGTFKSILDDPVGSLSEELNFWFFSGDEPNDEAPGLSLSPYTREEQKIGRNEPCPCGSGKKYKKCCGKN